MSIILSYFPGQKTTIFLETVNSSGVRTNSDTAPVITRIFGFNSLVDGYTLYDGYLEDDVNEKPMTQMDTGLYYVQITIPRGASSVGSFLVDVLYTNPVNSVLTKQTYQLVVSAPFGNFGITAG